MSARRRPQGRRGTRFAIAGAVLALLPAAARGDDTPWGGLLDGSPGRSGAPRRPFDPDTEVRLTGKDLEQRGATTLADALDLIPELAVRSAGRGGMQADVRGARKGWILVLVDGVPVGDPFYGNFDVSTIPVTDIEEIRVSVSPASPLDGPGGPGGVIEIRTIAAAGARKVKAHAQASSAPDANAAVTGRAHLGGGFFARVSAGGTLGGREYDVTMPDGSTEALGEGGRNANAALRLEGLVGAARGVRIGADLWAQHRSFMVPPGEEAGADILVIDSDDTARVGLSAAGEAGGWLLEGRGYTQVLRRDSRYFSDATLSEVARREELAANRSGVAVRADRPLGREVQLLVLGSFDSESADVRDLAGMTTSGRASLGEVASGVELHRGALRVQAAAGLGWPISDGASPWPEAKLSVTWAPTRIVELKAIGARKGRVPTLRERYQLGIGATGLAPEQATHGELQVALAPTAWLRMKTGAYLRAVDGLIKFDASHMALANVGDVTIRGLDARLEVAPLAAVSGGAAYAFTLATSSEIGNDPLDFLPQHRAETWITGRLRARASATARVRFVGEQLDNGETLPAYARLDASAFVKLREDLRGALRVDDLLDGRHAVHAGGITSLGRTAILSFEGVWE